MDPKPTALFFIRHELNHQNETCWVGFFPRKLQGPKCSRVPLCLPLAYTVVSPSSGLRSLTPPPIQIAVVKNCHFCSGKGNILLQLLCIPHPRASCELSAYCFFQDEALYPCLPNLMGWWGEKHFLRTTESNKPDNPMEFFKDECIISLQNWICNLVHLLGGKGRDVGNWLEWTLTMSIMVGKKVQRGKQNPWEFHCKS